MMNMSMTVILILSCMLWGRDADAVEKNGMILMPAGQWDVGTNTTERMELAERFNCHVTWLGDDLPEQRVALPAFWIDQHPVTNAEYLAFVRATGHQRPSWWSRAHNNP